VVEQWQAHGGVEERRWRLREGEGKIWGENGLGKRNGYRRCGWVFNMGMGFKNNYFFFIFFFFFKKTLKLKMALSTLERAGQGPARWPLPIITQ
jgi:hypothetical protein